MESKRIHNHSNSISVAELESEAGCLNENSDRKDPHPRIPFKFNGPVVVVVVVGRVITIPSIGWSGIVFRSVHGKWNEGIEVSKGIKRDQTFCA